MNCELDKCFRKFTEAIGKRFKCYNFKIQFYLKPQKNYLSNILTTFSERKDEVETVTISIKQSIVNKHIIKYKISSKLGLKKRKINY